MITIAHRAGNSYTLLEQAVDAGVDAVEIDVRLEHGRFAGRHDARLFSLPVYGGRWYVHFSLAGSTYLDEVIRRLHGRASLLVDVKNQEASTSKLLLERLRTYNAVAGTRMSGYWNVMRLAQASEPELRVYYSIGKPEELRNFWEMQSQTHEAKGASIRERLLDEATVQRFRAEGTEIAAWDVYDPSRARELVNQGVAVIISGDLTLLRALKEESSD